MVRDRHLMKVCEGDTKVRFCEVQSTRPRDISLILPPPLLDHYGNRWGKRRDKLSIVTSRSS